MRSSSQYPELTLKRDRWFQSWMSVSDSPAQRDLRLSVDWRAWDVKTMLQLGDPSFPSRWLSSSNSRPHDPWAMVGEGDGGTHFTVSDESQGQGHD